MGIIWVLCGMVVFISVITLLVGIFMQFSNNKDNKKRGLQMILYSVIAFVIGFGTCFATFTI
jgi:multisubunit Na+/H+ antiporter MnhC subunit